MNKNKEDTLDKAPAILDEKYEIFSSQVRLSIMLILLTHTKVKVTDIQQIFKISSGKLEHHLNILVNELKKLIYFQEEYS
jgi:predicted transcriptional regulator